MKYSKLFLFAALAAMALSCNKEAESEQIPAGGGITEITASFAESDTKTVLADDEKTVLWSPNDEISVFYNEDGVKFTSINSVPKDRVIFRSEYSLIYGGTETSEEPYLYGTYPYSTDNAQNGETLTLTVPAIQTGVEGSFARGAFPSVGRSKDTNIAFYNVCGGIRFTVGQSGITKIIITGNNNEVLVGKVNVQFDGEGHPAVSEVIEGSTSVTLTSPESTGFETGKWYYISILPTKLTNGFTAKLCKTGGKEGNKAISSSLEVNRSSFGSIAEIDNGVVFKQEITAITLSQTMLTIEPLSAAKLTYTITPSDAEYEWLKWESSDESIAIVNNGVITALKRGSCIISLRSDNGTCANCTVNCVKTIIYTAADFIAMLATPQTEGARDTTYTIMNDIDFTGYAITPENCYQGNFYATLDGQGHKFTNYTATGDMIRKLYGTFKDLTIESGSFTLEPNHTGGLFFEQIELGGVADNLVNKAEITGDIATIDTFHQGAFCGLCRGVMKNCKNYGNATINLTQNAKSYHYRFGGIAGTTTPSNATYTVALENCENHGNIKVVCVSAMATTYLGGITAVADSKACNFNISGCVNTGKISITNASGYQSATAKVYAGGLVGQRNEGDIKNCSNTGEIDLTELNFNNVFVGGLVAFQKGGYSGEAFQNCTVNANVKASFTNASSTTANPLANAGMIVACVGDAGVTFGGSGDQSIKVGGALYNGQTKIDVTGANVSDLAIGSACIFAPIFNISLAK